MKKNNLVLAAILLVLVGLGFAYNGPIKSWREKAGQPKNFLSDVDFGKIDKVEIGKAKTVLVKQGDDWKVGTDKKAVNASSGAIEQMITQLKAAQKNQFELASTNKDRKSEFQTDSSGIEVSFYQRDNKTTVVIGKMSSDYSSSYISRQDDDNTYRTVQANLWSVFMAEDWRDLAIFKGGDATKAQKVRLQFQDKQYVLEKKGEDWFDGKNKLNKDKVAKVIARLTELTAAKIPAQDFKPTGLDKASLIAQVTGDGLDSTLMIGKEDGQGQFYAKRGDNDLIYLIAKADRDELSKKPDQLK
ncbi:DUF4340 domain-containing protein [Candidatus Falkowbacteria bacterium]|nr:DUF4340 domain-containing protein [Candidatus Falkowbacteria bacterium]